MKYLLFTIICLFFWANARSQSLSAKELVNLSDKFSVSYFLKSRSFTSLGSDVSQKGVSGKFAKNTGTGSQETIFTVGKTISYLTRSKAFITNLLTQLQHQFKQTAKDEGPEFTYYQFAAGDGKNVSVNIAKSATNYHSLVIITK